MPLCNSHNGDFTFPKDRDLRKHWVSVVKRVTAENKIWIQAPKRSCVNVTSPIQIINRLNYSVKNSYTLFYKVVCNVY